MTLPKRKNELTVCYLEDIKNKYNLTDAEEEADISHEQVVIPIYIGEKEIGKVFQDFHMTAYDFGSDMRKEG